MYIVMLGGPGSGKGTTSEALSQKFNIEHKSYYTINDTRPQHAYKKLGSEKASDGAKLM